MGNLGRRINEVKDRIASACARVSREISEVKLVVVTKAAPLSAVREIIRMGFTDLGENRVQQLKKVAGEINTFLDKSKDDAALPKKVNWHMIGHLQRNKVRQVLPLVHMIHSIDTLRLAEEIDTTAEKLELCPKVFLQVNTSEEPQKYGVAVGAATHLTEQIMTLPNVKLVGLMMMAPLTLNKDVVRASFVRAHELFMEIRGEKIAGPEFTELSMGMSQDYEIAIEEGATMLRLGSAIFAG